jgi:hypothetical protein
MSDASEAAWAQWQAANPSKTICTHWHEAFDAGYDAALAVAQQEREAEVRGARKMQEAAAKACNLWVARFQEDGHGFKAIARLR